MDLPFSHLQAGDNILPPPQPLLQKRPLVLQQYLFPVLRAAPGQKAAPRGRFVLQMGKDRCSESKSSCCCQPAGAKPGVFAAGTCRSPQSRLGFPALFSLSPLPWEKGRQERPFPREFKGETHAWPSAGKQRGAQREEPLDAETSTHGTMSMTKHLQIPAQLPRQRLLPTHVQREATASKGESSASEQHLRRGQTASGLGEGAQPVPAGQEELQPCEALFQTFQSQIKQGWSQTLDLSILMHPRLGKSGLSNGTGRCSGVGEAGSHSAPAGPGDAWEGGAAVLEVINPAGSVTIP